MGSLGAKLILNASIDHGGQLIAKVGGGELEIDTPGGPLPYTFAGTSTTYINEGSVVLKHSVPLVNETQLVTDHLGMSDEHKRIIFAVTAPTDGTFTQSFDPDGTGPIAAQTTSNLTFNFNAAQVQSALEALPMIAVQNVG